MDLYKLNTNVSNKYINSNFKKGIQDKKSKSEDILYGYPQGMKLIDPKNLQAQFLHSK